ncbi:MAG: hypothetical protein LBF15_03990 [Candidatus Peribacteria bacterium]|jgi:hypothetical protein|nr:hypothetical protein [Candidatus Peribacteria bacterium]
MTKTTRDASIEVLKDSIRISQENIEIEKAKRDRELNTFDINVQISGLGDLYLKGNGIKNNHGPRRRLNPEDKVPKDKTVAKLKKHLKD